MAPIAEQTTGTMRVVIAFLALFLAAANGETSIAQHLRSQRIASLARGFVKALEFKHKLRVCNAFPFAAALDIYGPDGTSLTGENPMAYKACQDLSVALHSGDKLEFKVGDVSTGTFAVSDLPENDAVLLLVIHRHDTLSTACSFESHVFANLENPQVAVIDTYKGGAKASTRIMDLDEFQAEQGKAHKQRDEELRYDSVVAVNPGVYQVTLSGIDGETKSKGKLVALNHESYVVMRTGVEAHQGPSFPQELVVFPESDPGLVHSGAATTGPASFLVALGALFLTWFRC